MPPSVLSYVQGGCGDEFTQNQNANAFHHWGLVPRMLVDCSTRDLTVDLFGLKLPTPIFLSPIGVLGICTPDGQGDLAVARASAATGVPMIASTLSNDTLEAVAESLNDTPGFFQLYTPKDEASPKASSIAPRPPVSKPSSSPSTPGFSDGDRETSTPRTFRRCAGLHFRTTLRIPVFSAHSRSRPKKISPPRSCSGLKILAAPLHGGIFHGCVLSPSYLSSSRASAIPMTPDVPSTLGSKESTVRITEDARPTVASPRSICSPPS
jgi:hypothetical protein